MDKVIELSPYILGGIGLISLIAATIVRIAHEQKRQAKLYKILTFVGFFALFLAAAIAIWTVFASF